jgi:D-glycero-alpha-D-manno-heptose-7-phosphate kinase
MIVTKTPLRMSFFGGGSDIKEFYEQSEGLVVSTTINSYIYIALNRCVADHIKVIYSDIEKVATVEEVAHDRVREALKLYEINSNIEICSFSDVTVKGTGLGSSSTFTVGLVNALYKAVHAKTVKPHELAELASYVEIVKCGESIGKQDQYAAAYGGFNAITFTANETRVKPLKIPQHTLYDLQHNLFLFNTEQTRKTSDILSEQVANLKEGKNAITKSLVEMAKKSVKLLEYNKLDDFGDLLDASWVLKKSLSDSVTTPHIDEMYERAIEGGALGGKILGAGGGVYLLIYCPIKERNRMLETMRHYKRLPFKFTNEGSTIEMVS